MAKGRKKHKKGNPHRKSELSKLEEKIKRVYFSWGKSFCPALGADVFYTGLGWNHVIKGTRLKWQTERRLKLLPLAKRLVEECPQPPVISWRKYHGRLQKYWNLESILDNVKVHVVIIKLNGLFTFKSDFEKEEI